MTETLSLIHQKYQFNFTDDMQYKFSKLFENYDFKIETRRSLETYYTNLELTQPKMYNSYGPYTHYKFVLENNTVRILSEKAGNFRQHCINEISSYNSTNQNIN